MSVLRLHQEWVQPRTDTWSERFCTHGIQSNATSIVNGHTYCREVVLTVEAMFDYWNRKSKIWKGFLGTRSSLLLEASFAVICRGCEGIICCCGAYEMGLGFRQEKPMSVRAEDSCPCWGKDCYASEGLQMHVLCNHNKVLENAIL